MEAGGGQDHLEVHRVQGARCTGCKVLFYCGRECQEEHGKTTHRQHCKKLAQPRPILSNTTSLQEFQAQLITKLELQSAPSNPSLMERLTKLVHGMIVQWDHKNSIQETVDLEKIAGDLFYTRVTNCIQQLILMRRS